MKSLFLLLWTLALGSSFFGNSFVEYDSRYLENADPNSNTIVIKFLTVQERGIIFSAKGKDCHLEIGVSLGRPYILLKLPGTQEVSLSSTLVITSTPEYHVLRIFRLNNKISLTIDSDLPVTTTIHAEDTHLDFTKGVKIGTAIAKTVNTISGFRGCIKSLEFNNVALISPKSIPQSTKQRNVLRGCSSVLKNTKKETFSFSRRKGGYASFLVAKDGIALKTINLQFKFKSESISGNLVKIPTIMDDGFLTINYDNEYVSLYLTIQGAVKWNTTVSCIDKKSPQDGWHLVTATVRPGSNPSIGCNSPRSPKSVEFPDKIEKERSLEMTGLVMIAVDKTDSVELGKDSVCFKGLAINGKEMTSGDVRISYAMNIGCGIDEGPLRNSVPIQKISKVINVEVNEGESFSLIRFISPAFGKSPRILEVSQKPTFGSIENGDEEIDEFKSSEVAIISYYNDGSEHSNDLFKIMTKNGANEYVFHVKVKPVNDKPSFHIPNDFVYRPVIGFSNQWTNDLLRLVDPESPPEEIFIYVFGFIETKDRYFHFKDDNTMLSHVECPGNAFCGGIVSFTLKDINDGRIFFYVGKDESEPIKFSLRAKDSSSNNSSESNIGFLNIHPAQLEVRPVRNNIIEVRQGSEKIITDQLIKYATNAPADDIPIRFEVWEIPEIGELLLLDENNEWTLAESFTQQDVNEERVKYVHRQGKTYQKIDTIELQIYAGSGSKEIRTDKIAKIKVTIIEIEFMLEKNSVDLVDSSSVVLGKECFSIEARTVGGHLIDASDALVTFTSLPTKSTIYVGDESIRIGQPLKYSDFLAGKVAIRPDDEIRQRLDDILYVKIKIDHLETSNEFRVNYKPDPEKIFLVNNELLVNEGAKMVIRQDHLYASNLKGERIDLELIDLPKHGKLRKIKIGNKKDSDEAFMRSLRMDDIENQRIFYEHDGSETRNDSFTFNVRNLDKGLLTTRANKRSETFSIKIGLVNDNAPKRLVDRVFKVVTNSERLITNDDLWFTDADTDFADEDLVLNWRSIDNGAIVDRRTGEKTFEITQKDIKDRNVLFRHTGASYAEVYFWVKDGTFTTTGVLRVRAGPAAVEIVNTAAISLQKDSFAEISQKNLSASTNLNIPTGDLRWFLVEAPTQAEFQINGEKVNMWTQQDVIDGRLLLKHTPNENPKYVDFFRIKAYFDTYESDVRNVELTIFLKDFQKPMRIVENKNLFVREGESVRVSRNDLKVSHISSAPNEIEYQVEAAPNLGKLVDAAGNEVTKFSQADIDHDAIQYQNNGVPGKVKDAFKLRVTNQFTALQDIIIGIHIEPRHLRVVVDVIHDIVEGGNVYLSKGIKIQGDELKMTNVTVEIVKGPSFGALRMLGGKTDVHSFKYGSINKVLYIHDNSENHSDNMTVIARPSADDSWHLPSAATVVPIRITPVNNKVPFMENNKVLEVWAGSTKVITREELLYSDLDNDPSEIVYETSDCKGGYLANRADYSTKISKFSQKQIDDEQIIFVQEGDRPPSSRFSFQVTDGEHYSSGAPFVIDIQLLEISLTKSSEKFQVFPGESKVILPTNLWATTNEALDSDRVIEFFIERPPACGEIVDASGAKLKSFTQIDIKNKNVVYKAALEQTQWNTVDVFTFSVRAQPATPLKQNNFFVQVSYDKDNVPQLAKLYPLKVQEGGSETINHQYIDASNFFLKVRSGENKNDYRLEYEVLKVPEHGKLFLDRMVLRKGYPLTPGNFLSNKLRYDHDHSDFPSDSIQMSARLIDEQYENVPDIVNVNFTLPIEVEGINDNIPELRFPDRSKSTVNIIEGHPHALGKDDFEIYDSDRDEIIVKIHQGTSLGEFKRSDKIDDELEFFTNTEMNEGMILFLPREDAKLNEISSVTISFTDGFHNEDFQLLQIQVLPFNLEIVASEIEIAQGDRAARLSTFVNITTNGDLSRVSCHSTSPLHGNVILDSEPLKSKKFYSSSLNHINYVISDGMATEDSFVLSCKSDLVKDYVAQTTVSVKLISGVKSVDEFILLNPQPSPFTKFTDDFLDTSKLLQYSPIFFEPVKTNGLEIRRLEGSVSETERKNNSESVNCTEFNGFSLCSPTKFTLNEMNSGVIFIESSANDVATELKLRVSASMIPPVEFSTPVEMADDVNAALLPHFGISSDELYSHKAEGEQEHQGAFVHKPTTLPDDDLRPKSPQTKKEFVTPPIQDTRASDEEDTPAVPLELGSLLYVIPAAVLLVVLVIIIGAVIFSRKQKARRDSNEEKKKFLTKYSPPTTIKKEEIEGATVYSYPAAHDSSVKVTVPQNRYDSLMPSIVVRPLAPDESIYEGSVSDDGGHTAYAGSNYFGVLSMSNYEESRPDTNSNSMEESSLLDHMDQVDRMSHFTTDTLQAKTQHWV